MISVIVAVFNAELYLEECLDSLDEQSLDSFEVILVDDGSVDRSSEICDRFAKTHCNTKVIHQDNQGVYIARQVGIRAVSDSSTYITFLDADDCLRRDALEVVDKHLEKTNVDILAFNYSRSKTKTFNSGCLDIDILEPGLYAGDKYKVIHQAACTGQFNNLCSKVFKKQILEEALLCGNASPIRHGEDLLQLLPAIDKANSLEYIGDVLYFYRESSTSESLLFRESQLFDLDYVFKILGLYAAKWGRECKEETYRCVGRNCYWLFMNLVFGNMPKESKTLYADEIGCLLRKYCLGKNKTLVSLRVDYSVPLYLILHKHYRSAFCVLKIEQLLINLLKKK